MRFHYNDGFLEAVTELTARDEQVIKTLANAVQNCIDAFIDAEELNDMANIIEQWQVYGVLNGMIDMIIESDFFVYDIEEVIKPLRYITLSLKNATTKFNEFKALFPEITEWW